MLSTLNRYYGDNRVISKFPSFVEENRTEVFLYLNDSDVEKITGIAERHFSVMSLLLKHRFKTKEGLIRTSSWRHYHPQSTRI